MNGYGCARVGGVPSEIPHIKGAECKSTESTLQASQQCDFVAKWLGLMQKNEIFRGYSLSM